MQHLLGLDEPNGCCAVGAAWCEHSPRVSGGNQALGMEGWSDALLWRTVTLETAMGLWPSLL